MNKNEQFKDSLYNLSIEELQEKARLLSTQLTKAKYQVVPIGETIEDIEYKLNVVKNRITALRIRS